MTTPIGSGSSAANTAKMFAAGGGSAKPSTSKATQSTLATVQAEATETIEVTRQKAAKGDPVAIRKLARIEAAQKAAEAQQTGTRPSKAAAGNDHDADDGSRSSTTTNTKGKPVTGGIDAQA